MATRERDLSLLWLFLPFHSSPDICPNFPIPITHYFPGKKKKAEETPAGTLVPLPHISYFCQWSLTDSLIVDNGPLSLNIAHPNTPNTNPPASHPVTLKWLLKPHSVLLVSCAHWHQKKHCWTTGLARDARWGQKVVYLEATGFQADDLMKPLTSDFFL